MADYLVRPASLADLDALIALRAAVAGEGRWIGAELPLDEAGDRERFGAALEGRAGVASLHLAAVDGGEELVGFLGMTTRPYGVAELGMLVAAGWRGRGVGSALLARAIEWARADAATHKIALQLWPHNEPALRLYRRHGFVVEGYLHRHYSRRNGERWDALVMGLDLDGPPS